MPTNFQAPKSVPSMEDLILATAEECFLEKGFDGTSTTEIARIAGCNQALIHYYYRTKMNLFSRIFEKKFLSLYQGIVTETSDTEIPFLDKVRIFIETHYDLIHKDPRIPVLIFREMHRIPSFVAYVRDQLKEMPQTMLSRVNMEMEEAIRQGLIRPTTLINLGLTILSLNLAPAYIMPSLEIVLALDPAQKKALIARRKAEIVETVLASLRP